MRPTHGLQHLASPGGDALDAALSQTRRRIRRVALVRSATAGIASAIVVAAIAWWFAWSALLAAIVGAAMVAALVAILRMRARVLTPLDVAARIERVAPRDNLIVTAAALGGTTHATSSYIAQRVLHDAAHAANTIDARALFPAARAVTTLAVLTAAWFATLAAVAYAPGATPLIVARDAITGAARIEGVDVIVTPPSYMSGKAQRLHDPAHIDAPVGSEITLRVATAAHAATIETVEGKRTLAADMRGGLAATYRADADGYIALEVAGTNGQPADRRMIGITVTPDRAPRVTITKPGRDLFLSDSTRTIAVDIDADDDIGLSNIALHYTRVSGSGEEFKFSEGDIPLTITRTSATTWHAQGALRLKALAMTAGDMVVYRAAASDARPGAAPTLSDALIVQITAPGDARLAGYTADDEQDRYALSQEMVIQKTQQLIAHASSMVPDSAHDAAMLLAAEQRSVRAEFVFMMGGELAEDVIDAATAQTELHEEAEAQGESDLAAGRAVNRSHIALVDAIRAMSKANEALTANDLPNALIAERSALVSLQSAFSHTRYILRGLTHQEKLDDTRRLTGDISTASGDARPAATATESAAAVALRTALSATASLRGAARYDADAASRVALLSTTVARIDPSAPAVARAARLLNDAAADMMRNRSADARMKLDGAASAIAGLLRASTALTVAPSIPADLKTLDGALRDALKTHR